jgi:hypothetical protein
MSEFRYICDCCGAKNDWHGVGLPEGWVRRTIEGSEQRKDLLCSSCVGCINVLIDDDNAVTAKRDWMELVRNYEL